MPSTFYLQSHVFVGRAERHWVVLDVNRNKYLCVDRQQFDSLGPRLHGWEAMPADGGREAASHQSEAAALANQLLSLQILSEHPEGTKDARSTAYPLPTEAVDPDFPTRWRRSSCTHAPAFFASCARASRQLREHSFRFAVEFVRERKSRNVQPARPFDFARARSLVCVFDRLRLFYPRPYLCLFDSLALTHFLARFGLYPDWVFGVIAEPFEAHCWVQAGRVVLNDRVERISAYRPIMSV